MKKILSVLLALLSFASLSLTAFADMISPTFDDLIALYDPSVFFSSIKNIIISCCTGAGILALVAAVILFIIKQMRS